MLCNSVRAVVVGVQGHTTMQLLEQVQTMMNNEIEVHLHDFASSACRRTTTTIRPRRTMKTVADVYPQRPRNVLQGAGRFWALETRKGRKGLSSLKTRKHMELRSRKYDAGICREWSPSLPIFQRNVEKVKVVRKDLYTTTRNLKPRSYC